MIEQQQAHIAELKEELAAAHEEIERLRATGADVQEAGNVDR